MNFIFFCFSAFSNIWFETKVSFNVSIYHPLQQTFRYEDKKRLNCFIYFILLRLSSFKHSMRWLITTAPKIILYYVIQLTKKLTCTCITSFVGKMLNKTLVFHSLNRAFFGPSNFWGEYPVEASFTSFPFFVSRTVF